MREHQIHLAFHEYGRILFSNFKFCLVESVEHTSLFEDRSFWRVDVFSLHTASVVMKKATRKCDDARTAISNRKHNAIAETIIDFSARIVVRIFCETGEHNFLIRKSALPKFVGESTPFFWRIANPESFDRIFCYATLFDVLACFRIIFKFTFVKSRRNFCEFEQAVFFRAFSFVCPLVCFERHTGTLGKRLERTFEIESFKLFNERKNVSFSSAPKAVITTAGRGDKEAR